MKRKRKSSVHTYLISPPPLPTLSQSPPKVVHSIKLPRIHTSNTPFHTHTHTYSFFFRNQ